MKWVGQKACNPNTTAMNTKNTFLAILNDPTSTDADRRGAKEILAIIAERDAYEARLEAILDARHGPLFATRRSLDTNHDLDSPSVETH